MLRTCTLTQHWNICGNNNFLRGQNFNTDLWQCTRNPGHSTISHKQNIMWKMSCSLVSIFRGWWETACVEGGAGGVDCLFSFLFLLSWKNCCIIFAQSDANRPRRMVMFGWNGWTGAAGLSDRSDSLPWLPSGKSLRVDKISTSFLDVECNSDSMQPL